MCVCTIVMFQTYISREENAGRYQRGKSGFLQEIPIDFLYLYRGTHYIDWSSIFIHNIVSDICESEKNILYRSVHIKWNDIFFIDLHTTAVRYT